MERHEYINDLVVCGGGHGSSVTLWGITEFAQRRGICAIVTQSDDGSDSGELVKTYQVDPPGDRRMCAMPLASPDTQPENNLLNQYRFNRPGRLSTHNLGELTTEILILQHETPRKAAIAFRRIFGVPLNLLNNGHDISEDLQKLMLFHFPIPDPPTQELDLAKRCYGNLAISACELIWKDSQVGFDAFSRIFKIQGRVVPVSRDKQLVLNGEFTQGDIIHGESNIGSRDKHPDFNPNNRLVRVYHDGQLNPTAAQLIKNSFLRVIPPGSPETSIKPILVTKGYPEVLEEATKIGGRTVVIPPIMNSEGTSFKDAAEVIESYLKDLGDKRWLLTDVVLSATPIPVHGERRYAEYGQTKIEQDARMCQVLLPQARIHLVPELIEYDMSTGKVAHSQRKLGEILYDILGNPA